MRRNWITAGIATAASVTVVACVSVAVASTATADASGTSARSTHGRTVLGYIEGGDGLAPLRRNLAGLTAVGVDGLNVNQRGTGVSRPDAEARSMLHAAHAAGKHAELLVGNYSNKINDFDPAIAHRLFASKRSRRTVVAALAADARHGWNAIQLDLESLHGSDLHGLDRFVAQLRAALPKKASLSMAVMASTSTRGYRDDAYDLPFLSKHVNQVVLMAYDQHGPTWTSAGPVGGLPWAAKAMTTMLKSVPRSKAVFGVAGYGYTWPKRGTGNQLSDAAARRAATKPIWDSRQGEWHSSLRTGGTEWWSDARSLRVRQDVARRLRIQGVAVWSLDLSDRLPRLPR